MVKTCVIIGPGIQGMKVITSFESQCQDLAAEYCVVQLTLVTVTRGRRAGL